MELMPPVAGIVKDPSDGCILQRLEQDPSRPGAPVREIKADHKYKASKTVDEKASILMQRETQMLRNHANPKQRSSLVKESANSSRKDVMRRVIGLVI